MLMFPDDVIVESACDRLRPRALEEDSVEAALGEVTLSPRADELSVESA